VEKKKVPAIGGIVSTFFKGELLAHGGVVAAPGLQHDRADDRAEAESAESEGLDGLLRLAHVLVGVAGGDRGDGGGVGGHGFLHVVG